MKTAPTLELMMLKRGHKKMRLLIFMLILVLGCLGPSTEPKFEDISAIIQNPHNYANNVVNINATVVQMMPFQHGISFRLNDGTGEIIAIYTGNIITVDVGYKATFSGKIVKDPTAIHGSEIIFSVTGIKDVIPGTLEVPPVSTGLPKSESQISTIAEIRGNVQAFYSRETIAIQGKCVQAQDAGGYTYVEIDDGTGKMWIAIPESKVTIGQEVKAEGFLMINFQSKTLGKTFDLILFCTGLQPIQTPIPEQIKVPKAEGGYTIEEIYMNKEHLKGTIVKVRGLAIKVLEDILGMTWIHIRDGSGDPAKGTNELVVTYKGDLKINVGEEIIVIGILMTDRDYGAGYFFEAIIENAKIEKV
jgi:hypothetical protein